MTRRHTTIETPIGNLTLVADGPALCGVYYPGHWTRPDPAGFGVRSEHGFDEAADQLRAYLEGVRTSFDLPTVAAGDAFQTAVWELIAAIPYGATTTYGEIAARLGNAALARAVGTAVGSNPLSIVIPCHRVVGSDGGLTGYAGGLQRKRFLLDLEASHSAVPPLFAAALSG